MLYSFNYKFMLINVVKVMLYVLCCKCIVVCSLFVGYCCVFFVVKVLLCVRCYQGIKSVVNAVTSMDQSSRDQSSSSLNSDVSAATSERDKSSSNSNNSVSSTDSVIYRPSGGEDQETVVDAGVARRRDGK